jgi:DNA-binding transcriptional MerR regulator
MISNHVYSTAEVCEMFHISKSTLFRWERDGLLPAVGRDLSNQRQYTQKHIQAISQIQQEKLGRQFERAAKTEDKASLQEISEALSLRKFLQGDMTGLYELAEYPQLPPEVMCQLLQIAMEQYKPGDSVFCDIIETVLQQSRKLAGQ